METRTLPLSLLLADEPDCDRCIARLRDGLTALKGVLAVEPSPAADRLTLRYDPNTVSAARLEEEARRIGAAVAEGIEHASVEMRGLDCPDCAASIEKAVRRLPGVIWASANYAAAQLYVEFEPERVGLPAICRTMEGHGVRACPISGGRERAGEPPAPPAWFTEHAREIATALSVACTLLGLLFHSAAGYWYVAAVLLGGWPTARAGWRALAARAVDMNVLMSIAVIGAIGIGDRFEAATVVALNNIGGLLQAATTERTRRSIRSLMKLAPHVAHLVGPEGERDEHVEHIAVDSVVRVRPGERIPTDGEVVAGNSSANEAPITGESAPVEKGVGARVFAGTLNGSGSLDVRVTRGYRDTTLARILRSVEEAQAQRAPSQQFVDRFAKVYTPIVVSLAALVAVVPPVALTLAGRPHGGALWEAWLMHALSLLIIACPCALVISTPVAIVTAIGSASRRGALVKGGLHLEELAKVKAVLYDKTGTLTEGRFEVEQVTALDGLSRDQVLRVAAALEARSEHPLAPAFLRAAGDGHAANVTDFRATPGHGVRARVDGADYMLGNARMLDAAGVPMEGAREPLARLEEKGKTVVVLADQRRPVGLFALADAPRGSARETVKAMRDAGIRYQAMLTGDNARVAAGVAEAVGLDACHAGLLPDDKLERVRQTQREHGAVAMVGDGVNDAPALAAADVGIVMGAAGSDTAMETADVALMADDLSRLPMVLRLSRRTVGIIRQNVAFSLATKAGLVVAAVTVGIPLWLAVVGDVGVSLIVTLNALRLAR